MINKPEAHRVASAWHTRKVANKFNAPEVLGMLFKALEAAELEDVVEQLRRLKVPQIVNEAWMHRVKVAAASAVGKRVYLEHGQCGKFGVDYYRKGEELVVAADTLLASADYDEEHQKILKPLGDKTIVAVNDGYGWFKIKQVR